MSLDYKVEYFDKFNDTRGDLVVFLKNSNLGKKYREFGQIYFVTFARKGVIRGNHYHKKWREWFGIVNGVLRVKLKDVKTGKTKRLTLSAKTNNYVRLEIGPNIVHAFKSVTKASLLNYTDKEWSADDTFPEVIIK
jgi:dTDP-4-dehydrorhamnose 3,5-epimerase-like enzyme